MKFLNSILWFVFYFSIFAPTFIVVTKGVQRLLFGNVRIKQKLSRKSQLIISGVGVLLLLGCYEMISYRQQSINPNNTTVPGISALIQGFK